MKSLKKFIRTILLLLLIISIWKVGVFPKSLGHILDKIEYNIGDVWSSSKNIKLNYKKIQAKNVLVYNQSQDKVIYEKNRYEKILPASTAKFYFIDYALNILNLDDLVRVGDELDFIKYGSSLAYLSQDAYYSVDTIIEALMLPSGNDAALVLAAATGRKIADNANLSGKEAIKIFMNNVAMYLDNNGYKSTKLTEADGYSYSDYSSLDDMLRISIKLLSLDRIDQLARTYDDNVQFSDGSALYWKNTNEMINPNSEFYNSNVTGAKTGSLKDYYNYICRYEYNGEVYLILLYGSSSEEQRYIDTNMIIENIENGAYYL